MVVVLVLSLVNVFSETRSRVEWLRRSAATPALVTSALEEDAEPLIGHRMWKLVADTGLSMAEPFPLLAGPIRGTAWAGPSVEAECLPNPWRRDRAACAPVPGDNCMCGIYALKDRDALEGRAGVTVSGRIEMTGRVLEGERGFRTSHARVLGPLIIEARCDESLGVPTGLEASRERCLESAEIVREVDGHYSARCARHRCPEGGLAEWSVTDFVEQAAAWVRARYRCEVNGTVEVT